MAFKIIGTSPDADKARKETKKRKKAKKATSNPERLSTTAQGKRLHKSEEKTMSQGKVKKSKGSLTISTKKRGSVTSPFSIINKALNK